MLLSNKSNDPRGSRATDLEEVGAPHASVAGILTAAKRFIRRRLSIILFVLLLSVAVAVLYVFYVLITGPTFSAEAVLLLDPKKVEHDWRLAPSSQTGSDSSRLESQVEVLKSDKVALAVIRDLRLAEDSEFVGPGRGLVGALGDLINELTTGQSKSEFERTRLALKTFERRLAINRKGGTYAVTIIFQSVDPKKSAQIANAIVDAYIADEMDARSQATRRAANWIEDRMGKLRAQVSAAQNARAQGFPYERLGPQNEQDVAELNNQLYQLQVTRQAIKQQTFPISEARVITEASPPLIPSSPKILLVLAISVMGGTMLGVGAGILLDALDSTFHTVGQVSSELQLDCIAAIPALTGGATQAPSDPRSRIAGSNSRIMMPGESPIWAITGSPLSCFTEAFRSVKLAIDLLNRGGEGSQVIGITSTIRNEGKSTVAAALGRLLASSGARVILVDCDLRNPSLSSTLASTAKQGIVEVTSGSAPLSKVTWTDPTTSLVFLPAIDKSHPITSDVLASEPFRGLLNHLRESYDYVVVDLPTIVPLVDVRVVAHSVDSLIFVIEWGRTNINVVKHALDSCYGIYENLIGVILNKVDMKKLSQYDGS